MMLRNVCCRIALGCLMLSSLACAGEPTGRTVATLDDLSPGGYWAKGERVTVQGQPFSAAQQVTTRQKPGQPWGVLFNGTFAEDVPAGHLVWITFTARSAIEAGSPPVAQAAMKVQGGKLMKRFEVGKDWHRFGYAYRPAEPIQAGKTKLEFFLGYQAQTMQFADLKAVDLGPDAREADLPKHEPWKHDPREGRAPAGASKYRHELAAKELAALPEPTYLIADTEEAAREQYRYTPQFVGYRIVPANRAFGEAVELTVFKTPAKHWQAQYSATTTKPVKKGDALLIVFDARATASSHASGFGKATVMFGMNAAPYTKSFRYGVEIGHAWQRYYIRGVAGGDFEPGQAKAEFWFGELKQTIEIGGLSVMNFAAVDVTRLPKQDLGLDYPGREADAAWRAAAADRIERIRKAPLEVRVVNSAGQPVADAKVNVEQLKHAFWWGTTSDTRILTASGGHSKEDAAKHEAFLTSGMFNLVVPGNEFKWPAWVGSFGPYYKPQRADWAVDWAEQHGLACKGHVLAWNLPGKVKKQTGDDPRKIAETVKQRIVDTAGRYKGRLPLWDVINENYKNDHIVSILGHDVVADWFRWAKEASGGAKLFWNEIHVLPETERGKAVREYTEARLQNLITLGAPIDGLGIQGHHGISAHCPPELMLQRLDRLAELGLEIQFTEFDVNISDVNDPDQTRFQADYLRDFVTPVHRRTEP